MRHVFVILFLTLLQLISLSQLLWSYQFYVHQYDHTTTPNNMMYFIKTLPNNSIIFFNPPNSITTPYKDWLKAFNIDKNIILIYDSSLINATIMNNANVYFVSEPGGAFVTQDIIGEFVSRNQNYFELVASYGGDHKKYLVIRMNKNLPDILKGIIKTGLLFDFHNKNGYKIKIYKYVNYS